jgi:hypothetical protein
MEEITGQIYIITNTETNKHYVGQTLSHRLNKGKYKPFGYEGRFRDHISEAICNTKKKQCTYLNNSIRQYGKDKFVVKLLHTCSRDELDTWEKHFIKEHKSLYPDGYNLTPGGKTGKHFADCVEHPELNKKGKRGGCKERSKETRNRISEGISKAFESKEIRKMLMEKTQKQHSESKMKRFQDISIDHSNLDQYMYIKHNNGIPFVEIKINDARTSFCGKYQTIDILQERAREFLLKLPNSATLSNCSGNP